MKKDSPLLLGVGNDHIIISSDQIAFEQNMNVTILNDYNYGIITDLNYQIFSIKKNEKWNTFFKSNESKTQKKTKYYMLDEILEQPKTIETIAREYKSISIDMISKELDKAEEIVFLGAGSSFYAASILAIFYEKKLSKRCFSIVASEIDNFNILNKSTVFIFLSQSGETADLCYCLKLIKSKGFKIISLCNIVNSTLGYNSDIVYPLLANEEISVAYTKVFTAMIYTGQILLEKEKYLLLAPKITLDINNCLSKFKKLNSLVSSICLANNVFFIGKGIDYILALEASLKLKEVAYVNSYGFQSGELKHGSIALIDSRSVCISIISNEEEYSNVNNNLEEVKSRGAVTFEIYEDNIYKIIPKLQMIAFLTAKKLSRNVEQPKNLAKSVTVK